MDILSAELRGAGKALANTIAETVVIVDDIIIKLGSDLDFDSWYQEVTGSMALIG